MSRTVTFVVKQTQATKLQVADGTTVRRLRELVASLGYDVIGTETRIRIVRDGSAIIGHIKDEPLRRNDIVVFENDALRLQVSPEVAASQRKVYTPPTESPCSPACCDDRLESFKRAVLDELQRLTRVVANA